MRAKVTVNLDHIKYNSYLIQNNCKRFGVEVAAVTKMHSASAPICRALVESGVRILADSRIENLQSIQQIPCEKWLLRLPALSIAEEVVLYSDASLNSEVETIERLNHFALKHNKIHNVILMWDLGDLREGYFNFKEIETVINQIKNLSNIRLYGLGTNLSCYGAIMPTVENLNELVKVAHDLEEKTGVVFRYISGGNSTSYTLILDGNLPNGINQLRIGDTFYFGRDMSRRTYLDDMKHDCFVLSCEIIEIKEKPSMPIGKSGYAALNTKPTFTDIGTRLRAICSVGKQDIDLDLIPKDPKISILGASSDHLLVDITDSENSYHVGDILQFDMLYTAVMRSFTSKYVDKEYIDI